MGVWIVFASALLFCFQNIIVRVLFTPQDLWGIGLLGGYVSPTFANSFLLMLMRMLWVVPLMAVVAGRLYPSTWQELRQLAQPQYRPLLAQALVGGSLMFTYLVLLYVSIGLLPAGIALTLFFTYPLFTALLSWWWFGDRPSRFRYGVMGLVLLGTLLAVPNLQMAANAGLGLGVGLGVASGGVFAFYTVIAQKSFQQIHPVPFTWLSFATTLALSIICLLVWPLPTANLTWGALWVGGLLSALFTFGGHLLNNLGISKIGAADAAIVAATNPALTVVLAWLSIRETLHPIQVVGVLVVTLGIILLGQEKRLQTG